jgi:Raf kinase inhibitor-like YbhB/YbcL family protein
MEIKSPAFEYGGIVPEKYTCFGPNINPPLEIENVPEGTESFVLIFEDVDATPKPWTHWMIFNIPASTKDVAEGKAPHGAVEGLCNNHTFGYEGPCGKYFKGTHHYWFRLYALNKKLDLPAASEREEVEAKMKDYIIGKAELLGLAEGVQQ